MKNVFGLLVIVEPCVELSMILDWLALGNWDLLTMQDWLELERLANRCDDPMLKDIAATCFARRKPQK